MNRPRYHRLSSRLTALLAIVAGLGLYGWVVWLALREPGTPWPVKGFLAALWLLIAYIGILELKG